MKWLHGFTSYTEKKNANHCVSAKVNCPYCPSRVGYDGIRAHIKKKHPDVELPRGFTINLPSSNTD